MQKNQRVTVDIRGGLGNQLFGIACLFDYAKRTNRTPVVALAEKYGKRSSYWTTVLKKLVESWPGGVVQKKEIDSNWDEIYKEPKTYTPIPELEGKDVFLDGYFQSFSYFEQSFDELAGFLIPKEGSELKSQIDEAIEKYLPSLPPKEKQEKEEEKPKKEEEKYVSIHVRRTDYLEIYGGQYHAVLPVEYYEQTMHAMHKKLRNDKLRFVVFSDDIEWCKTQFGFSDGIIYVLEEVPDYIAFYMMALGCTGGHIIAASSFSWWAALLGWYLGNKQRPVYMPYPWEGPLQPKPLSLVVPGWNTFVWRNTSTLEDRSDECKALSEDDLYWIIGCCSHDGRFDDVARECFAELKYRKSYEDSTFEANNSQQFEANLGHKWRNDVYYPTYLNYDNVSPLVKATARLFLDN